MYGAEKLLALVSSGDQEMQEKLMQQMAVSIMWGRVASGGLQVITSKKSSAVPPCFLADSFNKCL